MHLQRLITNAHLGCYEQCLLLNFLATESLIFSKVTDIQHFTDLFLMP